MARAKANKLYRTFTRGLITEASPLTYPEDASIDELNTVISRKGNRTRRLGIDYQEDYELEDLGITENSLINEYVWHSVNNDALFNFAVVQVDNIIHFFRMDTYPVSTQRMPFTIDLTQYVIGGAPLNIVGEQYADFSSGSGFLFVAHKVCKPLAVVYDKAANTLVVTPIIIEVRDLEGIDDGLANDDEPTTLSAEHHYNLLNQGWITPGDATVTGSTSTGAEPPVYTPILPPWDFTQNQN